MARNPFGWDLPPGCTQRQIDQAFGGDDDYICEECGLPIDECECEDEPEEENIKNKR